MSGNGMLFPLGSLHTYTSRAMYEWYDGYEGYECIVHVPHIGKARPVFPVAGETGDRH